MFILVIIIYILLIAISIYIERKEEESFLKERKSFLEKFQENLNIKKQ